MFKELHKYMTQKAGLRKGRGVWASKGRKKIHRKVRRGRFALPCTQVSQVQWSLVIDNSFIHF